MSGAQRTVLVVEDNPDHALLVQLALERVDASLQILVCSDGREAVDLLSRALPNEDAAARSLPDLMLLDLSMPRLDGFGVLKWVRIQPALKHLPIVVLTSSSSSDDAVRALDLGASGYFTIPADLDQLGEQVRGILSRWLV